MKPFCTHSRLVSALLLLALTQQMVPVQAQNKLPSLAAINLGEAGSNKEAIPKQILKTGVSLSAEGISPNTRQLADSIGLTPVLEQIAQLRAKISAHTGAPTLESLSDRQDLYEAELKAGTLIQKANLEIDFAIAEIGAELQIYEEILASYTNDRDKLVARINAASFISNGLLWAICEGFSIPSYNGNVAIHPKSAVRWSIPSGITGIAAGIVPSLASMYTLKAVNGKKQTSEVDPNMLAKLFGYPTNPEIDYPNSIWHYLNSVPADHPKSRTRIEQLVDRWIADSNIPTFNDRGSRKQLDVLTASVSQQKGLSIASLSTRQVMLQQLSAEIMKMKRMLLELNMTLLGEKQFKPSES